MNPSDYILQGAIGAFLGITSLHGILLGILLLTQERLYSKANRFLAIALFSISIVLLNESIEWLEIEAYAPIYYLPIYIRTLAPIGIYLFVTYFLTPDHDIKEWERYLLIPIGLEILIEFAYTPILGFPPDSDTFLKYDYFLYSFANVINLIVSFWLIPLALKKVHTYQTFLFENYSNTESRNMNWLKRLLYIMLLIYLIWSVSFIQNLFTGEFGNVYLLFVTGLGLLLYGLGYFMILRYDLFQPVSIQDPSKTPESAGKQLSAKTDLYYEDLLKLMREQKLYTDGELNLSSLAEHLQLSPGYVSQIINEKEKKNFFEFVNHYRVEDVKAKLKDTAFDHYSIMGIALESGFKTKSTFNTVFKKIVGTTPSSYRKK
ncbi:MAG: helix-turn-helix domain-containing protein [Bacteroidota bacterium]